MGGLCCLGKEQSNQFYWVYKFISLYKSTNQNQIYFRIFSSISISNKPKLKSIQFPDISSKREFILFPFYSIKQFISLEMTCVTDDDCRFLFHCTQKGDCQHDGVFPLSLYTILIYLLIPICSGLVNSTGHSMGLFKVLIVMNGLRYQGLQATIVSQSLVVGTALPNYFSILVRKHPTMNTSLVNFNLVYILVPCCLLGSTFGSLFTLFIPSLIQQILTLIVFSCFSWGFYQKYLKFKQKQMQLKGSLISTDSTSQFNSTNTQDFKAIERNQYPLDRAEVLGQQIVVDGSVQDNGDNASMAEIDQEERNQILDYQRSYHLKDIGTSLLVFLVFEFIVFLVQGKLPFLKFHHCDWKYWVGLCILVLLTGAYLKFISKYLSKKFEIYDKLNLPQEIDLSKGQQFRFIVLGGFLAGLSQGILGVGSGSCMMSFLLTRPINATSASATTGYQVLFIGMAALIQGFINGEVNITDSAFYMCLCIVLGGIVTVLMANYLQRRDPLKVAEIVVIIAVFLSLVSVVMVIPDVITLVDDSGWGKIMRIKFSCDE